MVLSCVGLTGSTGMLGRHLSAALECEDILVKLTSRLGTQHSARWDLVDWKNDTDLDSIFAGVQAVIHAGALIPGNYSGSCKELFDVNVRSCWNIANWALKKSIPLVYISSSSVYLQNSRLPLKESSPRGWNPIGLDYGVSKLISENVFECYREQGLQVAIVRPSALYGYGGPKFKLPYKFISTAINNKAISLFPPEGDMIDFIHASDVSNAVVKILVDECWETFNIASGQLVSFRDLAEACVQVVGSGKVLGCQESNDTDMPNKRFCLDTSHAYAKLGWRPRVRIIDGLDMILRKHYLPSPSLL